MISAIIPAAGESKRMGQPKMLLPWGNSTVLEHVMSTLQLSGIDDILVVTGGTREKVDELAKVHGVRTIFNEQYANGEMLESIQCGLAAQRSEAEATLICLGDQPQVQERSVRMVCDAFRGSKSNVVVPSYQMRRGHPWLVARPLWGEILDLRSPRSPRDFLNAYSREIEYVEVENPSILEDLDTPEDYLKFKP